MSNSPDERDGTKFDQESSGVVAEPGYRLIGRISLESDDLNSRKRIDASDGSSSVIVNYNPKDGAYFNGAGRVDIQITGRDKVRSIHIHKNPFPGLHNAQYDFVEIFDHEGDDAKLVKRLDVDVDPRTSPTNPWYEFRDGGLVVGRGYGERLDWLLASKLSGVQAKDIIQQVKHHGFNTEQQARGYCGYVDEKVVEYIGSLVR